MFLPPYALCHICLTFNDQPWDDNPKTIASALSQLADDGVVTFLGPLDGRSSRWRVLWDVDHGAGARGDGNNGCQNSSGGGGEVFGEEADRETDSLEDGVTLQSFWEGYWVGQSRVQGFRELPF